MDYLKQLFLKNNTTETDIFRPKQRHYGFANQDKILYYIEEDNKNLGFFAMYRYWLEYLYFAEVCGYTPVVSAGEHFAYKEKNPIYETTNPFEYYFVQPAAIDIREAKRSSKVIISDAVHRRMVELVLTGRENHYKYNKRYLTMMGHIVKKYMIFNDATKDYIDKGLEQLGFDNNKTLGIHIRGTDYRLKYNNHPVYLSEDDCFVEVDRMLENGSYNRIFLATDDMRILRNFVKRYGEQLCFYEDVERSSKNKSVAFSDSNRDNHKYLLGLEVIRDMYTLSKCAGLVAGISQVAICAQINKCARKEQYEDIRIIDKGTYQNGHYFTGK